MNTISCLRVILAGCLSCGLGACLVAGPDEEDGVEPIAVSTEEEGMAATSMDMDTGGGGEESDAVGCESYGYWCLAKCSKSGNTQHVVGTRDELESTCAAPAEAFCKQMNLGYRTHACYGYVN